MQMNVINIVKIYVICLFSLRTTIVEHISGKIGGKIYLGQDSDPDENKWIQPDLDPVKNRPDPHHGFFNLEGPEKVYFTLI
jgi:hypothetical protein